MPCPEVSAASESGFIHPAAMASSGFRSMFQYTSCPPLSSNEERGQDRQQRGWWYHDHDMPVLALRPRKERLERKNEAKLTIRRSFDLFSQAPDRYTSNANVLPCLIPWKSNRWIVVATIYCKDRNLVTRLH